MQLITTEDGERACEWFEMREIRDERDSRVVVPRFG